MQRMLGVLAMGIVWGCGTEQGGMCEKDRNCLPGLVCASTNRCIQRPCPGTCEVPCEGNADCDDDQVCIDETGDDICRDESLVAPEQSRL